MRRDSEYENDVGTHEHEHEQEHVGRSGKKERTGRYAMQGKAMQCGTKVDDTGTARAAFSRLRRGHWGKP